MSAERGTGGKNANYGWSPREEPPDDPAVSAWLAALWAKPFTYAEYEEMRTAAASRVAVAPRLESREDVTPLKGAR
jgi:hypothetical protein